MNKQPEANSSSPSTPFAWRRVKIGRPPEAPPVNSAKRLTPSQLARKDLRRPLKVTIAFRGGPECWWELRARGLVLRRPGSLALHDVLRELYGASTRAEDGS